MKSASGNIKKRGRHDSETAGTVSSSNETRYWLFKSEPNPRYEKGVDVSYSIDQMEKDDVADWDGVRNYQARNLMRDEMKVGDLAFFYHSNCKQPGIVGIVKVVKEGYPDECALDKKDPHYDPKSTPENPRWHKVDLKFVRRLKRLISLEELKAADELKDMAMFTKARLSVQPVRKSEWDFILGLEDRPAPENKAKPAKKSRKVTSSTK